MSKIDMDSMVDIIFSLRWKSDVGSHTDCYQANNVNIWRDYLPQDLLASLQGKEPGERVEIRLKSGESIPGYNTKEKFNVKSAQFAKDQKHQSPIQARFGRFYPRGLLQGVSGIYKADMQPFRCVGVNNGDMTVDLNHPIAGRDIQLSCLVGKVAKKNMERGGTSVDWIAALADGPGMQARWQESATDFFTEDAFDRKDERPDGLFYGTPRFVQHIDDTAVEMVRNTYGRFLSDDMHVLDLMSSWQSHVPENVQLIRLAGLGINSEELKKNRQLTEYTVQDLNTRKVLPYADHSFDVVLNTVSVEYLTDPVAIFKEAARVLRKGGRFILTFSNRWFAPKSVKIWEELHDFERMGLVLEYFLRSGDFTNLNTYSFRGLPRPHNDKYFPEMRYSDPIYAVWGEKS
jgi:SAM-dependent methyltransferase/FKBP-type peptidyl-prolyl cis-trans isomerase 2